MIMHITGRKALYVNLNIPSVTRSFRRYKPGYRPGYRPGREPGCKASEAGQKVFNFL